MAAELDDEVVSDDGDDVLAGDPVLSFLAGMAALADHGVEVTVLTNGMIVSGRLIDELTYLQRLADVLQRKQAERTRQVAGRHDLAAMLRDQIRGFQPGAILGSDYVHLAEATISRGAGDVSHVELWRGAAEDVAGWSVG